MKLNKRKEAQQEEAKQDEAKQEKMFNSIVGTMHKQ